MDTRRRLTLAAAFCLLPLLPLTIRLTRLQVMDHQSLETRAADEFSRSDDEIVPRGDIVDRNGFILAQSIPVWACFVDRKMAPDERALARRLGPVIGMRPADVLRKLSASARFPWVKTDLSYEQSQKLRAARIEGVGVIASQRRFYPNGDLARSLLGEVSPDGRGLSGIELVEDSRLVGKARKFRVIRDGSGRLIYKSVEEAAAAPEPLKLTIDRSIQYFAEQALREAYGRFHMQQGMVLVQDPGDGDLLAMATYPANPLRDPIVQDAYEPGSIFKVVTSAAALESKSVTEKDAFFCENGSYKIAPGVTIHDDEPEGDLTLQGILEKSSNIGISKVVQRIGPIAFYRAVRAFGFGSKTGIELPGETAGELRPLTSLTKVGLASASFGYGVGVTPLQVVTAYSAIANGGILWQPRVLGGAGEGVRVRRVMSQETMSVLARMLESVVDEGTGTPARIPGYRIAGKTGTSHRLDLATKRYSNQYNASFVGFLPASRPRWTILVTIQAPRGAYYGAEVAAPVFAEIAKRLLMLDAIPPDDPSTVALARGR